MEKFDVRKKELKEISENYKNEFSEELSDLTSKVERGILAGLIVSGLVYVSYKFLQRTFEGNEKDSSEKEPVRKESQFGQVSKIIAESAAIFLLNLAKDKLLEYLKEKKDEATEDTSEDN